MMIPRSIRWRLPLSYASVSLLTALILSVVWLETLRLDFKRRELESLTRNAELISSQLANTLEMEVSHDDLKAQLKELAIRTQARITLSESDGSLWADSGPFLPLYMYMIFSRRRLFENIFFNRPILLDPQFAPTVGTSVPFLPSIIDLDFSTPIGIGGFDFWPDGGHLSDQRVSIPVRSQNGVVLGYLELSEGLDYADWMLGNVQRAGVIAGAIGVLLAALAGWLVSRQMSRPILVLSETTTRMAAGDLSVRAGVHRQDELGQLARSFDEMAARVEGLVIALRRFAADAAHELNTPLTALRNSLDLAVEESHPAELLALLRHGQSQVQRLEVLAHDLLDLSRLEAGTDPLPEELVDLAQLLLLSSEKYASRAEQAGLNGIMPP